MKKLPSKWGKLQFGATILHGNIRELTLLDNQFEEKGVISFNTETHTGEGMLFGKELKIINIDKQLYEMQFSEYYSFNLLNQNTVKISSDGVELLNLRVPLNVSHYFYRYADVIMDEKLFSQVEISRNCSIFYFFRMILGLITLGLIKQKFKPIIPNAFFNTPINHKALVLGVIMAQLVYFPYDYDDWS